jgi:hypothetical protein
MATMSKNEGFTGGLRTAGLVLSIIGTVFAAIFTVCSLVGAGALCAFM